ncbi:MAG: hypothetical protein R2713_20595 [Ilumatobacteraceae bacterium]
MALFASFIEIAGAEIGTVADNLADGVFRAPELAINVAEPEIFIGLLNSAAPCRSCSPPSPSARSVAPPAWWCRRSASSSPTARS